MSYNNCTYSCMRMFIAFNLEQKTCNTDSDDSFEMFYQKRQEQVCNNYIS